MRSFATTTYARSPRGDERAFTLIELLAVVAILGMLSAVTMVSLCPTIGVRRQAAARWLASKLNGQRSQAITSGIGTWVSFDSSTNTCSFLMDSVASPGWGNASSQTDPDRGGPLRAVLGTGEWSGVSISSVSVAGGGTVLGFDWQGRPINSAGTLLTSSSIITLSGPTTVTIRAGTGLATAP